MKNRIKITKRGEVLINGIKFKFAKAVHVTTPKWEINPLDLNPLPDCPVVTIEISFSNIEIDDDGGYTLS